MKILIAAVILLIILIGIAILSGQRMKEAFAQQTRIIVPNINVPVKVMCRDTINLDMNQRFLDYFLFEQFASNFELLITLDGEPRKELNITLCKTADCEDPVTTHQLELVDFKPEDSIVPKEMYLGPNGNLWVRVNRKPSFSAFAISEGFNDYMYTLPITMYIDLTIPIGKTMNLGAFIREAFKQGKVSVHLHDTEEIRKRFIVQLCNWHTDECREISLDPNNNIPDIYITYTQPFNVIRFKSKLYT